MRFIVRIGLFAMFGILIIIVSFVCENVTLKKRIKYSAETKNKVFNLKVKLFEKYAGEDRNAPVSDILKKKELYDPYSYKPMKARHASSFILIYSIGPDLIDNNGSLIYDPTNGLYSQGDLSFKFYPDTAHR